MDVFLSYNRRDAQHAAALNDWLGSQGVRTFFDQRDLGAGQLWLPELERWIEHDAQAIAVLVGPAGLGNTQQYEYQLALTRQTVEPGFPVIPVLLPGTPDWRVPRGFLGLQTWISFAAAADLREEPVGLQRLLAAIRHEAPEGDTVRGSICPFKGLGFFEEADADVFFGRDAEAGSLLATVTEHRVAALIGRSGSGKSSLVRAGLFPRLRGQAGGGVWDRLIIRPGEEPLIAMADALSPGRQEDPLDRRRRLEGQADALRTDRPDILAGTLRDRIADARLRIDHLLIVVDQAEELFSEPWRLTDAESINRFHADSERFIRLLLEATTQGPASLVLTIRSDFFDPLMHSPFAPVLKNGLVQLGRINDLHPCIERPAALVGLRFAPGLVDRIVDEVGPEEGNLPLLQHALERTWRRRSGPLLTADAYTAAGGVAQAINQAAKDCFEALSTTEREATRRLFLRLVRPGEGSAHVRIRAAMPDDAEERHVMEVFAHPDRRLLFVGEQAGIPVVEMAHEALVRGWDTLRQWVEDSREKLRVRDAVVDWRASAGDDELIPPGSALLRRARDLLANPGDVRLDRNLQSYIQGSLAAADAATALARRRRRTVLASALGLALIFAMLSVAAGLFYFRSERSLAAAEQQRQSATAQRERAEANFMAAQGGRADPILELVDPWTDLSLASGAIGGQVMVGDNSAGETCTQPAGATGEADVYCGTWDTPSIHVQAGGSGSRTLRELASTGEWRTTIDERLSCENPLETTVLGDQPALAMKCKRRVGGWPHSALVALVDGRVWYADSTEPATKLIERSIGILAGRTPALRAPSSASGLADLFAARLGRNGRINQFTALMVLGVRASSADDPVEAESDFHAALDIQTRALGPDSASIAMTLVMLAMEVSAQGRFREADELFDRAESLASSSTRDQAVMKHYRGLHLLNQGRTSQGLKLLADAATAYSGIISEEAAQIHQTRNWPGRLFAVRGLIDVHRSRAIVLRDTDNLKESSEELQLAAALAKTHGLEQSTVGAKLNWSISSTARAAGDMDLSLSAITKSSEVYERVLPGSKSLAETYTLRARILEELHRHAEALSLCRTAVGLLNDLRTTLSADQMNSCLAVCWAEASMPGVAQQAVLREMFAAAQFGMGSRTSRQIAQATARLSGDAQHPGIAAAIRSSQDATAILADLYRKRDQAIATSVSGSSTAGKSMEELERQIAELQAKLRDTDEELQATMPRYDLVLQGPASAADVLAMLHPSEALVMLTLADLEGWAFLLRNDTVSVSRIAAGRSEVAKSVKAIRGGIELPTGDLPVFPVAEAQRLYTLTLGELSSELDGVKALVVVPTGALISLPFEVLLTGPAEPAQLADAPWLVKMFPLTHLPDAQSFVALRKFASGSHADRPWIGFGNPVIPTLAQWQHSFPESRCRDSARLLASLPELPFATRELEAARDLLGADESDLVQGPNFTADAVRRAQLKRFRIIHFATHFMLPEEVRCMQDATMITSAPAGASDAAGALLAPTDVIGLDLDADLIVLSAGNTAFNAFSDDFSAERHSALASAFFFAGARSLMVAHWNVYDQTTAFLVADTFRRMVQNPSLGSAGALRDTQLGLLHGAGSDLPAQLAHPFYWAPMVILGD